MGSPSDVQGHSHHSSIWIAHHDVGGVNFWSNSGEGRIVHRSVLRLVDTATSAICETLNDWVVGGRVLLKERRRMEVEVLDGEEWFLTLDLQERDLSRAYIQYLGQFKIAVFIFSVVPYFALVLMTYLVGAIRWTGCPSRLEGNSKLWAGFRVWPIGTALPTGSWRMLVGLMGVGCLPVEGSG